MTNLSHCVLSKKYWRSNGSGKDLNGRYSRSYGNYFIGTVNVERIHILSPSISVNSVKAYRYVPNYGQCSTRTEVGRVVVVDGGAVVPTVVVATGSVIVAAVVGTVTGGRSSAMFTHTSRGLWSVRLWVE